LAAAAVGGGIVLAGVIGATFGFLIPGLVHRWKLDSAIASGPVTLALTDVFVLASYFGFAAALLL
jgi:Mg/Co/Ni transporter MgtE